MHEAMARYQTLYGLKPIGAHRRLADELFNDVEIQCEACGGRGLRDVNNGASWERCVICRGLGILFTKPAAELPPFAAGCSMPSRTPLLTRYLNLLLRRSPTIFPKAESWTFQP